MSQHRGNTTPFLIPFPNTPPHEDLTQPSKKWSKLTKKKTSWIWEEKRNGHNFISVHPPANI